MSICEKFDMIEPVLGFKFFKSYSFSHSRTH